MNRIIFNKILPSHSAISNNSKLLFIIIAALVAILIADTALERISGLITASSYTHATYDMQLYLFIVISLVAYGIGQYVTLLSFVNTSGKRISDASRRRSSNYSSSISSSSADDRVVVSKFLKIARKMVLTIQYLLIGILVSVILLIVFSLHYYTALVTLSTIVSYGLAIFLSGLLSKSFFTWFKSNKNLVVLSYGVASAIITVNLVFASLFMVSILASRQSEVMIHVITAQPTFDPNSIPGILNSANVVSGIIAFISMWFSTALLLRHHSKKLGIVKYWTIVAIPLVYFLSQFIPTFVSQVVSPMLKNDPIFAATVFIVIFAISKPAGGILFGIAFLAIASALKRSSAVRDYMIISSIGVVLLFVSSQGSVINLPYPPFGLITVSFVGLSSYMMFIGLYSAAISVSEDVKLRQSIRREVMKEATKFLDNIGTAHMEQELTKRVMIVAKKNSETLQEQSGIQPSISETEIKEYLNEVMLEVARAKHNER